MAIKIGDSEFNVVIASAGFGDGLGWWWQRLRIKLVSLLGKKLLKALRLNYLIKFSAILKQVPIVTKTITLEKEKGNYHWWAPWRTIRSWEEGMINAVGLTNKGMIWWVQKRYPKIQKLNYQVILSIAVRNLEELERIIYIIWIWADKIKGVELNVFCPNNEEYHLSKEEIIQACQMIKKRIQFLLLKVSPLNDYGDKSFWQQLEGLVDAVSINAMPWSMIYRNETSPFEKYGYGPGAVSGKNAQFYTWAFHRYLSDITKIPVILPSIWTEDNLREAFNQRRVPAISMCALFLRHPTRATGIIEKCLKEKI